MMSKYICLKNTDAIGKHFKSTLIKSYSNRHGKIRANGLLFSRDVNPCP